MYKIVIADDESWVLVGLKKIILKTMLPFEVIGEANNGLDAYKKVTELKPDILISDIRMPGLNGLELMRKLNENNQFLKVIFISGYAEFSYAQEAITLGAFDYFLKPIEESVMKEKLERFMLQKENQKTEEVSELYDITIEDPRLHRIICEIKKQYTEEISLGDIAERYGLSIGYLSSLIKKKLGLSFSEYIQMRRIEDAKRLLLDEHLSIDRIAEMVGYKDYYYFIRVFKNATGISPSKYRKDQYELLEK